MADSITVLAVSGSPSVRAAVAEWARKGLLRPSVWIECVQLAKEVTSVMSTEVTLVGKAEVTCSLREALGTGAYRLIRLVSVRQVLDDETDTELNELFAAFTRKLRERVSQTTTLLRLNVVVPSDQPVRAEHLIDPDCAVNVVVSPEDRPGEDMIDQGLDDPAVFDGHTAFACATVGALWSFTADGAFDEPDEYRTGNGGAVVVVRSFARIADCRPLPKEILPALLEDGVSGLGQYRPHRHNYVVDDKKLIAEAAEAFVRVDGSALCYHPPERPPLRKPKPQMRKTLRMLLSFWRQAIGLGVLEWSNTQLSRLKPAEEQWLTEASEDVHGTMSPDEAAELAALAPDTLRDNPLMPRTMPAEPGLWPPLRQLGFGLVDGGELPGELQDIQRLRPGVSNPTWVASPPEATFELEDAERKVLAGCGIFIVSVRPADSYAAGDLLRQLNKAEQAVLERKGTPSDTKAEQEFVIRNCRQRFEAWQEHNHGEHSLIGHLVRHVDKEIGQAQDALVRLQMEYDSQNKERADTLKPLERIKTRLVWHLTGFLSVLGTAVVGGISALLTALHPLLLVVTALAGVGTLVTLVNVYAVARRATGLEGKLAWLEARRAQTMAAVKRWPGEVERLTALYNITLDWGQIIGWMLHKPFAYESADDGWGASAPRRPEAFNWGTAQPGEHAVRDLATVVTREVFTPGWISELYDVVYAAAVPASVTAAVPDAYTDADRSPAPYRPIRRKGGEDEPHVPEPTPGPPYARERLLEEFRTKRCGDTAGVHLAAEIGQVLLTMQPEKLLRAVQVKGERQDDVPAIEFLSGGLPKPFGGAPCPPLAMTVFSTDGRIAERGKVVRVHLWGVAQQLLGKQDGQVQLHRGGAAEDTLQYQFSVIRLDVSAGCEPEDLRLPRWDAGR